MGRVLASHARATIVTVGAAAAVLLAGCSGGAGAQPGPSSGGPPLSSTTSTSTASASPTTTASRSGTASVAIPAAARAHTDEGAKAFARFYVEAVSESGLTADSTTLHAITDPNCKGCRVFIDLADELKAERQHVDRKSIQLRGLSVRPDSSPNVVVIDCLVEDLPSKIVDENGSVVSVERGDKLTLRNTVKWSVDRWIVAESLLVER